jgi:ribonuclease BN (tRNA processing enzyme)
MHPLHDDSISDFRGVLRIVSAFNKESLSPLAIYWMPGWT